MLRRPHCSWWGSSEAGQKQRAVQHRAAPAEIHTANARALEQLFSSLAQRDSMRQWQAAHNAGASACCWLLDCPTPTLECTALPVLWLPPSHTLVLCVRADCTIDLVRPALSPPLRLLSSAAPSRRGRARAPLFCPLAPSSLVSANRDRGVLALNWIPRHRRRLQQSLRTNRCTLPKLLTQVQPVAARPRFSSDPTSLPPLHVHRISPASDAPYRPPQPASAPPSSSLSTPPRPPPPAAAPVHRPR